MLMILQRFAHGISKDSLNQAVLEGTFVYDPETVPIRPCISVEFMLNRSASGLKVESLSLLNEKWDFYKGVKSVSRGKLQLRV